MKTVKDIFYFVEDVMTITGLSRSKSYKIIADLNRELSDRGYTDAAEIWRLHGRKSTTKDVEQPFGERVGISKKWI